MNKRSNLMALLTDSKEVLKLLKLISEKIQLAPLNLPYMLLKIIKHKRL